MYGCQQVTNVTRDEDGSWFQTCGQPAHWVPGPGGIWMCERHQREYVDAVLGKTPSKEEA